MVDPARKQRPYIEAHETAIGRHLPNRVAHRQDATSRTFAGSSRAGARQRMTPRVPALRYEGGGTADPNPLRAANRASDGAAERSRSQRLRWWRGLRLTNARRSRPAFVFGRAFVPVSELAHEESVIANSRSPSGRPTSCGQAGRRGRVTRLGLALTEVGPATARPRDWSGAIAERFVDLGSPGEINPPNRDALASCGVSVTRYGSSHLHPGQLGVPGIGEEPDGCGSAICGADADHLQESRLLGHQLARRVPVSDGADAPSGTSDAVLEMVLEDLVGSGRCRGWRRLPARYRRRAGAASTDPGG